MILNPVDAVLLMLANGRIPEKVINMKSFNTAREFYNELVGFGTPRCVYETSIYELFEGKKSLIEKLEGVLAVCNGSLIFSPNGRIYFSTNKLIYNNGTKWEEMNK